MNNIIEQAYMNIIKKELVPAMGCTEPVAIAFCAAKAKSVLNEMPEKVIIRSKWKHSLKMRKVSLFQIPKAQNEREKLQQQWELLQEIPSLGFRSDF